MPTYRTGAFGRRLPNPSPEDVQEQDLFPPSREEKMQTVWMIGTTVFALVVLVVGLLLRYTIFAKYYEPKPSTPTTTLSAAPTESPSPLATLPSPSTFLPLSKPSETAETPAPAFHPPSPPVRTETTPDGEPISPPLSETGGRIVTPR